MQRNRGARLFPLFLTLVVVVIIIIGIIALGKAIFGGNQTQTQTTPLVDDGRQALLDTASDRSVRLIVRGPIVAHENFKTYTIIVSPASRTMTVYQGYTDDKITNSKALTNNKQSYEQFVYALDKANMMHGIDDKSKNDVRGICATGYVYEYAVLKNNAVVKNLWTSTCSGSKGTLDASTTQLKNLFMEQIPGSGDMTPFKQGPSLNQF